MEKEKKWESSAEPSHPDARLKEQLERAKKETDRRKNNLEQSPEGSYKEKNSNPNEQSEDLDNQPKESNKSNLPEPGKQF
jgi:hypothetical protein